jgi:hypothetical protein
MVVFFSLFFSKKIIASDFIVSFDYKDSAPLDSNVAAFQNWWNHFENEENFEKSTELFKPYGVNTSILLNVMGYEKNPQDWEKLNHRLDYAVELTVKEKEQLLRFIKDIFSKINERKQSLKTDKQSFVELTFAVSAGICKISFINNSLEKIKAPRIIANQKLAPKGESIWIKKNGKFKKPNVHSGVAISQYFSFSNLESLNLSWSVNDQSFSFSIPSIEKNPPYIVDFFASEYAPMETQRVFLTWNVLGTKEIMMDMGVGVQPSKWQIGISPEDTIIYTLTAKNAFGSVSKQVKLDVEQIVLTSAIITFFTPEKGDPKAIGTKIVATLDGYSRGVLGRFEGVSELECEGVKTPYVGPFKFLYNAPVYKRDFVRGQFTVKIEGENPDEWLFSPIVILQYSDGSKRELVGFGTRLLKTGAEAEVFKF